MFRIYHQLTMLCVGYLIKLYISGLKKYTTTSYIPSPCSSYRGIRGTAVVLDLLSFEPFHPNYHQFHPGAPNIYTEGTPGLAHFTLRVRQVRHILH